MEDSLITKGKLYHLKRTEDEVKINDYNPRLLKVWKANMDIQYIAESTMALVHYRIIRLISACAYFKNSKDLCA